MDSNTEEAGKTESSNAAIKVGAVIGAVIAAIPAVPVAWIGVVFSSGDDPHPVSGMIRWVLIGLVIIGGGVLCGGAIGALVARVSSRPPDEQG